MPCRMPDENNVGDGRIALFLTRPHVNTPDGEADVPQVGLGELVEGVCGSPPLALGTDDRIRSLGIARRKPIEENLRGIARSGIRHRRLCGFLSASARQQEGQAK
jgi:hypothetical protein